MTELTKKVLEYQRTGIGLERAYAEAAPLVYQYPRRRMGFTEDDCGEFLLFFHKTLLRLFEQYRHSERPFEAYLYGTLKWQIRSFAKLRRRRASHYEVINHRDVWEEVHPRYYSISVDPVYVQESLPGSRTGDLFEIDAHGRLVDPIMRRRLTILALKSCLFIEPPLLEEVADAVAVPVARLEAEVARARGCMGRRIERRKELQRRRVRAYVRLRHVHDELITTPEIEKRLSVAQQLLAWHRRLRLLEDELSRVPRAPTNGEIAAILGIPKGTVDSSLFYFKQLLRHNLTRL